MALFTPPPEEEVTPPESIEDDGALVKLNASVQQLGGHDRGVAKTGRLAADFFTVEDDVFPVSSGEEDDQCCESPVHVLYTHESKSQREPARSSAAPFSSDLCSRPLSLSPTLMTMTSLPEPVRLAISFLMVLATPEWMAPHRPRSEVTPMIKCLPDLSSGALMSAFSYSAGESNIVY